MLENKKSLYRIYRPSTFKSLAGHKNIVEILVKQLKENKMAHALLFAGQRGTGKTSVARIYAKSVNCTNLVDGYCCEKCENCLSANKNSAPDIFEIDAASNNGVDEIRGIKNNVTTLPVLGKYKIYIIDEVHMLTKGAFNALLKTLEEPPEHAVFILATTEYAKIPATIVSRCQTFNFQKIDKESLKSRLKFICDQEKVSISDDVLEEIFYLSEGSLRDALNVLEQLMIVNDVKIEIESLKSIFYVATKKEKLTIIESIAKGKSEDVIRYFEKADNQGMDFDVFALSLIEIIKEIIEYRLTKNSEFLRILEIKDLESVNDILVEHLFDLADNLSEAYSKTKGTTINFSYLLISLLKSVKTNVTNPVLIEKHSNVKNNVQENIIIKKEIESSLQEIGYENLTTESQKISVEESVHVVDNVQEKIVQNNNQNQITKATLEEVTFDISNKISFEKNSEEITKRQEISMLSELVNLQSLETLKTAEQETHSVEILQVINLLVGAKRESRDFVDKKINECFKVNAAGKLLYPNKATTFYSLYKTKIAAVSKQEVLLICDNISHSKLINLKLENERFRKKLFKELDKDFVVYSIDSNKWEDVKFEFKNLKAKNALPKYNEVDVTTYYENLAKNKLEKTLNNDLIENATKVFDIEDIEIGE